MAGGATLGLRPTVCPIRSALIAARTALAADETLQALLTKRDALSCGPATVPPRELSPSRPLGWAAQPGPPTGWDRASPARLTMRAIRCTAPSRGTGMRKNGSQVANSRFDAKRKRGASVSQRP